MSSDAFIAYCIEHSTSGYCKFYTNPNRVHFKNHPIRATYFEDFELCYSQFMLLKDHLFFDKFNNPIENGTFSIVEFAVSAYTKPTKYVTLITKIKDSKNENL